MQVDIRSIMPAARTAVRVPAGRSAQWIKIAATVVATTLAVVFASCLAVATGLLS